MLRPEQAKHQKNRWGCGPAALYHAIRCYGESANIRELERLSAPPVCECSDNPQDGRCEHQLAYAAKEHGFRLEHLLSERPRHLYKELRAYLADRVPVLLCVDHYSHWLTAVRADTRGVWICDSSRDQVEVMQRWGWKRLAVALAYGLPPEFHMYPLVLP